MGKTISLFPHGNAWRNLQLMFQFCLKISSLPLLTIYSMLLTLLSNYPEPCLAFLFGLVMFAHESLLIILLPLEHMQQAGSKGSPIGWRGLSERMKSWDLCSSPQILLTFQQRAVGVDYSLQKSQWQHSICGKVKNSPLFFLLACCTPLSSAMGAVVLMLFLCEVPIIAIPLTFISTGQKLTSSNLETRLWKLFLA